MIAWLLLTSSPTSDPTTQIGVLATLLGSVGAIIAVVVKLMRDGRKRERGEDSLLEQQNTQLYQPTLADLIACRAQRDRLSRQRDALIASHQAHQLPIPPEAYQ